MEQEEGAESHQSGAELLFHQRDEGQAVGALLCRQVKVGVELLKNSRFSAESWFLNASQEPANHSAVGAGTVAVHPTANHC